jgi:hypothetical protein
MFKRKRTYRPIHVIDNIGHPGHEMVSVGDFRPRDVPLATHRQYDLTLKDSAGAEYAATKATRSLWARIWG